MGAGSSTVSKFYPVQGSNKFETVSFPITKAFAVDMGAGTSKTNKLFAFPKGSIILGFAAKITEAVDLASATATFQLGFVGTQMLSSKHTTGKAALDVWIGPSSTAVKIPLVLSTNVTSSYTFQVVASDSFTAGKADVYVTYIPHPHGTLSTADFLSYVTT